MKIALEISYIGTNYCGWQSQNNNCSIAETIQNCYEQKLGEKIKLYASGRTDAGVHALCQVAHFETHLNIEPQKFSTILNTVLPIDIKIIQSYKVDNSFHARFDAKAKTYLYKLYTSQQDNPFLFERALKIPYYLDIKKMKKASKVFIGTHDFTSFCKTVSNDKDCTRTIYDIKIMQNGNNVDILIKGNGFLHNMVRIIVGSLIDVGSSKLTSKDVKELMTAKNRTLASKTMPPYALYLQNVEY